MALVREVQKARTKTIVVLPFALFIMFLPAALVLLNVGPFKYEPSANSSIEPPAKCNPGQVLVYSSNTRAWECTVEVPEPPQRTDANVLTVGNNVTGIAIAGVASGTGTNIGLHASAYGGVNNHAALFDGDVVVKGKLIMEGYKCVPTE